MTVPASLSLACGIAGVQHRVATAHAEDPGAVEEFGMMVRAAEISGLKGPAFVDSARTTQALHGQSVPLLDGLTATIAWMREQRVL
jgi:hypothetical protein